MIARYHFNRDSSIAAFCNGGYGFGSGWIDHALQSKKNEIALDITVVNFLRCARSMAHGKGENAQSLVTELVHFSRNHVVVYWCRFSVLSHGMLTTGQNAFSRSLYENNSVFLSVHRMKSSHVLMLGFKGYTVFARKMILFVVFGEFCFFSRDEKCCFGWISFCMDFIFFLNQAGVVAEQSC